MTIIILAAGYAVRLQPLTLKTPKPLLMVGGRTILDRIVDKISALGRNGRIYIISNGKFFNHFTEWLGGSKLKDRISVINDTSTTNDNRLGAIKDIELVIENRRIDDDMLVIAGDNLFEMNLADFLKFARAKTDGVSVAVYDIGDARLASSFGVVSIDGSGRMIDFEEKPASPKSTLVSTGIYYFPKEKLAKIKEYANLKEKLDAPGYYISWLNKVDKVYGFKFSEKWHDIGNMESYNKADTEYSKMEKRKRKGDR